MRNLTRFGLLLAAGTLLASCSSDNYDDVNISQTISGDMVAIFDINIPGAAETRAAGDVGFADGSDEENAVKNARFYIYKKMQTGDQEDDYKCIAISDIYNPSPAPGSNEIIRKATVTLRLEEVNKTDEFFGLCIVNLDATNNTFKEPEKEQTFGTWRKQVLTSTSTANPFIATVGGVTCYTMTNAPTFADGDDAPTATNITTLVPLTAANFAEAPKTPTASAGTFYVQRGVAKVQIWGNGSVALNNIPSELSNGQSFVLTNWAIDMTNTKTFPVQNVENFYSLYNAAKSDGAQANGIYFFSKKTASKYDFNHLWWGEDPNYGSFSNGDFSKVNAATITKAVNKDEKEDAGNIDYCLENTMAFGSMKQDQTTRVVFKGTYILNSTDGAQSFIVNPENDKYYSLKGVSVKTVTPDAEGKVTLKALLQGDDPQAPEILATIANHLEMAADGSGEVYYYENGVTYFTATIKHFHPQDETPWNQETEVANNLANYSAKHTGRFGVLRNNVYEILINKVLGYGSPVVPPTPSTPNDEVEVTKYNISVDINVLKWAKRDYSYDLK